MLCNITRHYILFKIGELFQRSLMGHMGHEGVVPSMAYNAYIVSSLVEAGLKVDVGSC